MKKSQPIFASMAVLTVLSAINQVSTPCFAADKNRSTIEQSLIIKASAKTVFEGIQMSRVADPSRRHLLSHNQDTAVIDEKIPDLPVIGTAHLVYKEIEVPYKRIDYLLVSSDKFKAFEGSWELTPLDNGRETKVSLKSYSDLKVWMPFSKDLSSSSTVKDINRRLNNLKNWCDDQGIREARAHQDNGCETGYNRSHSQNRLAENSPHAKVHADAEKPRAQDQATDESH